MIGPLRTLKDAALLALRRRRVDARLGVLCRPAGPPVARTVLVDGVWDNPNHWLRYALLRAALGLAGAREVGVTGRFNAEPVSRTFGRFGIREVISYPQLADGRKQSRSAAQDMVGRLRAAEQILRWDLPHGLPADFVYDGILKRQRAAVVDVRHPSLVDHVAEALDSLRAAERLLDRQPLDLVVVSHQCNFFHGALVWLCLLRAIPVLMLAGAGGTVRITRLERPRSIYDLEDAPERDEILSLPGARAHALGQVGLEHLKRRLGGQTDDLGAAYAYSSDGAAVTRQELAATFGWDPRSRIIGVYASNWFDYPHGAGMSRFRDFHDWLVATLEAARDARGVCWLFKGHPCDEWYGGVTLAELMPPLASHPHVRLASRIWSGSSLLACLDGLVTCHGTAGVEFAALGGPVLLADRGWYHEIGFAKLPASRAEYLAALRQDWWSDLDLRETTRLARIFAAFRFCRPADRPLQLEEDAKGNELYRTLPLLLRDQRRAIEDEVAQIREWFRSGQRGHHTLKMLRASEWLV